MPYDHKQIEKKWQEKWDKSDIFQAKDNSKKEKFYCLVEFPYPSGVGLHVGHVRTYTGLDIVARKKRMEGKNVLFPIGWDAFGLPTENYAIKTGRSPQEITRESIDAFRRQMKMLGLSFDWSREINTTDPAYYRWTQWMFLQFFKKGLAYKKKMPINWCLSCKTGLANEEVVGGKCERCGGPVEKRDKEQWMMAITKYADRLLEDLKTVDYLPKIKKQQEEWIGKSEGAEIIFHLTPGPSPSQGEGDRGEVRVFTTRPDTLFGATYIVLAPEHSLVGEITTDDHRAEVEKCLATTKSETDIERGDDTKEKTGVFTGAYAVNPANNEKIPIWVADYVLMSYGTGAIMAVPAHDERDFAFATKYKLPIKLVVAPKFSDPDNLPHEGKPAKRRKVVHAIVRRPSDGKVLLLNWHANLTPTRTHLHTFIIGGIEEGEDVAVAGAREVQEETGYRHVKFIKELGLEVHTEYHAAHKDENRYAEIRIAVFDLVDDEHDEIPESELKNHEPVWVDESDVAKTVNVVDGPIIWSWHLNGPRALTEEGIAVNSDFLNGLPTWKAKDDMISWLEEKGLGARQTQYKLRDWIFSRQRYWGEPIPLVHCGACKNKIEKEALRINFRRQDIWAQLVSGRKTIETRVLNPEEPARYFGNFGARKYLCAVNKNTGEEKYLRVIRVWQFKSLAELFEHPDLLKQIAPDDASPTLEKWEAGYAKNAPDYLDRIKKNGLIAWQVESIIPGWIPVSDKQLPVILPEVENYHPTDTGESPLAAITDWVNTKCPECGGPAKRETDTMPNWAGSSWYFLRYVDPENNEVFASLEKLKYWMPVDLYNGGMEHTTLHLLYSRFWNKFLFDQGFVPTSEPYARRHSHGLILASDNNKMSKSRGNVVNPDDIVNEYGADTLRTCEAFIGPFEEPAPWNESGVIGVRRFLERVAGLAELVVKEESKKVTCTLHQTIKKVTEDIDDFRFNTAVAQMMIFVNVAYDEKGITKDSFLKFIRVLCPFAPHLANEIFSSLGGKGFVEAGEWPEFDFELVKEDEATVAIQVNGKLRGTVVVSPEADEAEVRAAAEAEDNVKKYLAGKEIVKVVFVRGKLMNIVVK